MKYFHLLFFIFFRAAIHGQCSPTINPQSIYYANTTYSSAANGSPRYLCGPSTVLWDTLSGCPKIYCNASTTLNLKHVCLTSAWIWLKNGAVLNMLQNSAPVFVYYEQGAIINDPYSVAGTSLCSSITFPNVNCSIGLTENLKPTPLLRVWPCPSSDFLTIDLMDQTCISADITIYDQLGKIVYKNSAWRTADKNIPTKSFDSGSYFLSVRTSRGQQTHKLLILH